MKLSDAGRTFLEQREGIVLHRYRDSGGRWTIGVGHLLSARELQRGTIILAGKPVSATALTRPQADALCSQDVAWAERDVSQWVTVALEQHQFDALVSFVYNVGPTNFAKSAVLRDLNRGGYALVPGDMARWIYDAKQKSNGLIHRRALEAALWRSP